MSVNFDDRVKAICAIVTSFVVLVRPDDNDVHDSCHSVNFHLGEISLIVTSQSGQNSTKFFQSFLL